MPVEQRFVPDFDGSQAGDKAIKGMRGAKPYRATGATHVDLVATGRWAGVIRGEIAIEDLDDEEIIHGQVRMPNGKFSKRPPAYVPRVIFDKMRNELFVRGQRLWQNSYLNAISTFAHIASDPLEDSNVRLKAAKEIVDRLEGKAIERIATTISVKPYEELLEEDSGIDYDVPGIIDAEVISEPDEPGVAPADWKVN